MTPREPPDKAGVIAGSAPNARKKADWLLRRAEGLLLPEAVLAVEGAHLDPKGAVDRLRRLDEEAPDLGVRRRLEELEAAAAARAPGAASARDLYLDRHGCAGTRRFRAGADVRLYAMSVETFPRHVNNVVLVVEPGHLVLFDVGSGADSSRRDLALGFAIVQRVFGEDVALERVDLAIVSHAHIDHFGGVKDLRARTAARLCVHELDARVLECFEERVVVATKDVEVFLRRAGAADEDRERMLEMYALSRQWFTSEPVDRTLRDGDVIGAGHRVIHVPGHCPGLICLLVGDVLCASDHVLSRITPHQFPQAITPFAGLEHYFHSLGKVRKLEGVSVAIGGHEEPIVDLRARVDEIAAFHRDRLTRVREACRTPRTTAEIARDLFGERAGYEILLALEETGAHVEYLHALGKIRIANLDEVAGARDPVIRYVAR